MPGLSGDRQGCTPTNVPRHGKSRNISPIYPYNTWVFMGYYPQESLEFRMHVLDLLNQVILKKLFTKGLIHHHLSPPFGRICFMASQPNPP